MARATKPFDVVRKRPGVFDGTNPKRMKTHTCALHGCPAPDIVVGWGKSRGRWVSQNAIRHFTKHHAGHPIAVAAAGRAKARGSKDQGQMSPAAAIAVATAGAGGSTPPSPVVAPLGSGGGGAGIQALMGKQARDHAGGLFTRAFNYDPAALPDSFVDGENINAFTKYVANSKNLSGYSLPSKERLRQLVEAERERADKLIKLELDRCRELSGGSDLHLCADDGTPGFGKVAYKSVNVSTPSRCWSKNVVVNVGFEPLLGAGDKKVERGKQIIADCCNAVLGRGAQEMAASYTGDAARNSVGIGYSFGFETFCCTLHAGGHGGLAAAGLKTYTRAKKLQNPFPEAERLHKKVRKEAQYFYYEKRRRALYKAQDDLHHPRRAPSTDNQTRISSTQRMDYSWLVCWEPTRKVFASPQHYDIDVADMPKADKRVTVEERDVVLEIEAVLSIVRTITVMSQCEMWFVAAHGVVSKLLCLKALRSDTVPVLNMATLGSQGHERVPRKVRCRAAHLCRSHHARL